MDRVTVDVRVQWGAPCLRGTGTTVARVLTLHRRGATRDEILDACPGLTAADVEDAFEWYDRFGEPGLLPCPPSPEPHHPRVAVDPDVQGGYPVVRGTRVPVDAVVGLWEEGFTVGEIRNEYPDLTAEDVEDALAYDLDARGEPSGLPSTGDGS